METNDLEALAGGPLGPTPFDNIEAPEFRTPEQERQAQAIREASAPGLGQVALDAIASENILTSPVRSFFDNVLNTNPEFEALTEEQLTNLTEGLPTSSIESFGQARNFEHAHAIRTRILGELDREERLSAAGATGTVARLAAAVLDPAALAVEVGTGGLATAALVGTKATRLQRAATFGLAAGTTNTAIDLSLAANDATGQREANVFLSFAAGVALGGAVGAFTNPGRFEQAVANLVRKGEVDEILEAGGRLTPKGEVVKDAAEATVARNARKADVPVEKVSPRHAKLYDNLKKVASEPVARAVATTFRGSNLRFLDDVTFERGASALDGGSTGGTLLPAGGLTDITDTGAVIRLNGLENLPDDRIIATLAHEIAHTATLRTDARTFSVLQEVYTNLLENARVTGLFRDLYGNEAGRNLARKVTDVHEFAAEVVSRSVLARHADRSTLRGRRGRRSVEGYLNTQNLTPDQRVALDEVADTLFGFDAVTDTARKVDRIDAPSRAADEVLEDAPRSKFGKARIDLIGRLKQHPVDLVRGIAASLVPDRLPNLNGEVVRQGAYDILERDAGGMIGRFRLKQRDAFAAWQKDTGRRFYQRFKSAQEFNETVGRIVRGEIPAEGAHPELLKAVENVRAVNREALAYAKANGLEGFENVSESSLYLTRAYDYNKLLELAKTRRADVEDWFSGAIRKADLADGVDVAKIARIHVRTLLDLPYTRGSRGAGNIAQEAREKLTQRLTDEFDLDPSDIADLVDELAPNPSSLRQSDRSRRRLPLDESFRSDSGLTLSDFTITDADQLTTGYIQNIVKTRAERDFLQSLEPFLPEDADIPNNFESALGQVRRQAQDQGLSPEEVNKVAANLDHLYRNVFGIPTDDPTPGFTRAARIVKQAAYASIGGAFGPASLGEAVLGLGGGGARLLLETGPSGFPRLFSNLRNLNSLEDVASAAQELSLWTGRSLDNVGAPRSLRNTGEVGEGGGRLDLVNGRLDRGLEASGRIVSRYSGTLPITAANQRAALSLFAARYTDEALETGRKYNPFSTERKALLGINEDLDARIKDQIRKHARGEGADQRFRFQDWDDIEARETFLSAATRNVDHVVQRGDPGLSGGIHRTHPIGQLLTQFRSFGIDAYTNHLLRGVSIGDAEAFEEYLWGVASGSVGYALITLQGAAGREDWKEYLDKRLTPGAIIGGVAQRATFASLFPSFADTLTANTLGFETFSQGRASGLSGDFITGTPAYGLLSNVGTALSGVVRPAVDSSYDFTQEHANSLRSLGPLANMAGIRNLLNHMQSSLPQRNRGSRTSNVFDAVLGTTPDDN